VVWALAPHLPAVVLEANFGARDADRLRALGPAAQVHCTGPREELERRFEERQRHPGHADDRYPAGRHDQARPLELGCPVLVVDTTGPFDLDGVERWVRQRLMRRH